jgi:hypothetical protein
MGEIDNLQFNYDYDYECQHAYDGPRLIQCKYCDFQGYWIWLEHRGWRLRDDKGNIHLCRTKKTKQ